MEQWRIIQGFENYAVSSHGEVMNKKTGKLLRPNTDQKGYLEVWLSSNGKRKKFSVHRLVALSFLTNEKGKPQVNHIDGNKSNNDVSNLEFVTNSENILHSFRKLGRKHTGGRKRIIHNATKGGGSMAKRIKLKQLRVGLDLSQEQMADSLEVSRSMYAAIENGQRYGKLQFWKTLEIKHNVPKEAVYEMMTEIEF